MPRSEHLRLRHDRDGASHALSAEGELDLLSAPILEDAVAGLCAEGAHEVVIDLHRLDFVDSAGLRALVQTRRYCEGQGCDFSLARVQPPTRRLFEVTGLVGRFGGRGHSHARHGSEDRDAGAGHRAARHPDLEVPLELNSDAARSARNYVRDILRGHPSRSVRETAMLLTSDLVTPLVARAPATFLRTGELRVWLRADAVRIEVLVPRDVVSTLESTDALYDGPLFERLGGPVSLDADAEVVRAAFELDASLPDEHAASPAGGRRSGAARTES